MSRWLLSCAVLAARAGRRSPWTLSSGLAAERFPARTQQVAARLRAGTARKAVDRFIRDALDEEPLRERLRSGRADIFDLFGGNKGTQRPMQITSRHPVLDRATQIGAGDDTVRLNRQQHRATLQLRSGRIARWREDETRSSLLFEKFSVATRF